MPAFSVSCSPEQGNKMHTKGISASKAFQLGIEIFDQAGGLDAFRKIKEERDHLKEEVDLIKIMNMEWRKKYIDLKRELNAFQVVFERTSVVEEAEKKEAERVERLLQESKQNQ